ncbi:MAG: hypothetical protein QOK16_2756 [Solirubrobacteraceae bacterium]|jgi:hypothetical protein|nr:hypothetical protein [Solirubrobacteraceae bacterium]MEA2187745.1 hypothetical protein [Solirubrobacteraceae bacterium]
MLRKILITSVLASLVIAGTATAAQAPTLGPLTIIKAGQKTPIDVAGNHLHQGATIRKGTELRRWLVTMHGASNANITLKCGPGAKHVGLGQQEGAKISFAVSKGSDYFHRTIRVHFYPRPNTDANGAKASVYALCKTS